MSDNNTIEASFRHVTLEGTPYEIGRKEAELIKNYYTEEAEFFFRGNDFIKPASLEKVKQAVEVFGKYCPNINDEIRGFADYFGRTPEEIIYYSFTHVSKGNCGHFAVLPQKTSDGKTYAGRSYEWSADDDKRLMTVRAEGVYAHMGFSLLLFGRYDGINEKGLCVTMTNGIPLIMSQEEGLRFWMVIRILLDKCKNVDEAVDMIRTLPISSFCSLVITDKNYETALVEIHNSVKTFKKLSPASPEGFICSTNHYILPEMQPYVKNRMQQSVDRYSAITKTLSSDKISRDDLKRLLSTKMPEGLACHHYEDGLGTLWSILYDIENVKAEICFGSPVVNKWHNFDLNTPEGVREFKAFLPNEESTPQTWMQI